MRRLAWLAIVVACGSAPAAPDAAVDADTGPVTLELLAGGLGGPGNVDGVGAEARFDAPHGVAVDAAGNVFVTDTDNDAIRRITPDGTVTTIAGSPGLAGSIDGPGSQARFFDPLGIAVDAAGNLYVADSGNETIRKITANGMVSTLAGSPGNSGVVDGSGDVARFDFVAAIAVDGSGTVYVGDSVTVRKVTPDGTVTTLVGGSTGSNDGSGSNASFEGLAGIAIEPTGDLVVTDQGNQTIRKITSAGVVTTIAGSAGTFGDQDGSASAARFFLPAGIAVDAANTIYIADTYNSTIRTLSNGVVTTIAGSAEIFGGADGAPSSARFFNPNGLAIDARGSIYVADTLNSSIRVVTTSSVTTLAGLSTDAGFVDGTGSAARFAFTQGVAADVAGNAFVADLVNSSIREVTPDGVVTTLAGNGGFGFANGRGSAASFCDPQGIAVDATGIAYVADSCNNALRQVTPSGYVDTYSPTPFVGITGTAVDGSGNVYVSEYGTAVRKIGAAHVVTTLATIDAVYLAADFAGYVYATGADNVISRISPAGVITTIAGQSRQTGSTDGSAGAARFNEPVGIAIDTAGNLFIADFGNSTIRKIAPGGVVTTIAGTPGVAKIVLGASPGLSQPIGLAIIGDSLVITDSSGVFLLRHGAR